jgi:gluconolactonase
MLKRTKNFLFLVISIFLISCNSIPKNQSIVAENAQPTLISNKFVFTEGPASDKFGNVYFTDQPYNKIYKWDWKSGNISLFMENTGRANGTFFDADGNLITCSDMDGQVWKISENKSVKILVKNYKGKRLNGPNDLWIDDQGGIYLTDPLYIRNYWKNFTQEIATENLYYLPKNGDLTLVDDHYVKPNGIIGSNKSHKLYVSDFGGNITYQYDILAPGKIGNKKVFCNMRSDGMTIDNLGNVYLTGDGVTVFDPQGKQIDHFPVSKDWTANVTFGGENFSTLFITSTKSVYTLKMNVHKGK